MTIENSSISRYQIEAQNDAETSENRMHSDDIAQRYGFSGALVSGVSVYGYLTHPLVAVYGKQWLSNTVAQVNFLKPAYQNDLLSIDSIEVKNSTHCRHHMTSAQNANQVLLARLESWQPDELPAIDPRAYIEAASSQPAREAIHFDIIKLDQPAKAHSWTPSKEDNQTFLDWQREDLDLYRNGEQPLLHPYYLLNECNQALMRMFVLPAWIHVGSKLVFRNAIKVGQTVEVRTIPIGKWQRKGHQFIKLYLVMRADGEIALEVEHIAIFRIAEKV